MTQHSLHLLADVEPQPFADQDRLDGNAPLVPDSGWTCLHTDATHAAYALDLGFLWRWIILRHGEIVQEGCSLSLNTAERSIHHVLAFYALNPNRGQTPGHCPD